MCAIVPLRHQSMMMYAMTLHMDMCNTMFQYDFRLNGSMSRILPFPHMSVTIDNRVWEYPWKINTPPGVLSSVIMCHIYIFNKVVYTDCMGRGILSYLLHHHQCTALPLSRLCPLAGQDPIRKTKATIESRISGHLAFPWPSQCASHSLSPIWTTHDHHHHDGTQHLVWSIAEEIRLSITMKDKFGQAT